MGKYADKLHEADKKRAQYKKEQKNKRKKRRIW